MIWILALTAASELDPALYAEGHAEGELAATEELGDHGFAIGAASGFGLGAGATLLIGPVLGAPLCAMGCLAPGTLATLRRIDPPPGSWQEQELGYSVGYRDAWRTQYHQQVKRSFLGGMAGTLVGATLSYLVVDYTLTRQGYEYPSPFQL